MANILLRPHVPTDSEGRRRWFSRLVSWWSALAVGLIVLAMAIGFYQTFSRYLLRDAEHDAQYIGYTLLGSHLESIMPLLTDGSHDESQRAAYVDGLDQGMRATLNDLFVTKIKIYDRHHTIVYSNDERIIGLVDTGNRGLMKALGGEVVSAFKDKAHVRDIREEQRFDRDVVETYLPIRNAANEIVGSFEIYMDVSKYREGMRGLLVTSVLILLTVLVIVFALLVVMMRRLTRVICEKDEHIHILHGLLPICSYCKKIRNEKQVWEPLEVYISTRSESSFTHGICPECLRENFPECDE